MPTARVVCVTVLLACVAEASYPGPLPDAYIYIWRHARKIHAHQTCRLTARDFLLRLWYVSQGCHNG